jgi:outer membrane protein OmpA-like peptidoglycan-associated protein
MNLFSTFKESIPAAIRLMAAQHVGETPEKTQKALDALSATVTGGLLKRASTETGLDQLYRTLQKPASDTALLENLPSLLDSPERTSQLIAYGSGLVSQLLPDKKSSIATMISTYAKVRNSSATSLLGLMMPLVLATLRREVTDRHLDVQGLGGLLADQREAWLATVPEGLADKLFEVLGIDNWHGMEAALRTSGAAVQRRASSAAIPKVPTPTKTATAPVVEELDEEPSGANWGRWVIPAVAVAALAGGAYWYFNRPQTTEPEAEPQPTVSEQAAPARDSVARADSASLPATRSASAVADSAKAAPPPTASPTAASGFAAQMDAYLKTPGAAGRTFLLDGVKFGPAASMYTPESEAAIGELVKLLQTYPKLQIKLIGYAAEGAAVDNKRLSSKRANNIKSKLIESGINFIRIDAVGLGAVAGNSHIAVQVIHR